MRYRVLLGIWLATDLLLFMGIYALVYFLRVGWIFSTDFPFDRYLTAVTLTAPLWLLVVATTRTFHFMRSQATLRNAAYITYAGMVGVALFTLVYYFRYTAFFSRLLLVYAFVLQTGATYVWHILYQRFMRLQLRRDPPAFPTLIVGLTRESRALIGTLNRRLSPLKPVAILESRGTSEREVGGVPVRGKLNLLEETLAREKITHLVQCSDLEQSLNLLSACRNGGITYLLLPSVLGIIERDERVESLERFPVTLVEPRRNFWSWFFR
jgi:FlaA1/EpsC-like NDP-sugar epimerase